MPTRSTERTEVGSTVARSTRSVAIVGSVGSAAGRRIDQSHLRASTPWSRARYGTLTAARDAAAMRVPSATPRAPYGWMRMIERVRFNRAPPIARTCEDAMPVRADGNDGPRCEHRVEQCGAGEHDHDVPGTPERGTDPGREETAPQKHDTETDGQKPGERGARRRDEQSADTLTAVLRVELRGERHERPAELRAQHLRQRCSAVVRRSTARLPQPGEMPRSRCRPFPTRVGRMPRERTWAS